MTTCNRPECGQGTIDDHGFCTACDLQPLPSASVPGEPAPAARPAAMGVAQVRPDPWYGLTLVDDRPAPDAPETAGAAMSDGDTLAEEHRYCANPGCGRPVGRGGRDRAGRTVGFCSHCGTRFDFTRVEGLVIAGRYQVRRLLGQGSYGAAYLAHDPNLGIDVVVKKLRTSRSDRERDVLVGLRHDAVVRILGYEEEGEGDHRQIYLVLEYLPGSALAARRGDGLDTLLAHGLRILQALDYLHLRNLLHCDVKPLNIIRFQETGPAHALDVREAEQAPALDRVRLIDFGAARWVGDLSPVDAFSDHFAPLPDDDEFRHGPTPGFDLYGLGRTLQDLCRGHLAGRSDPGVHSLELLLQRATDDTGPEQRFTSARQFGEQLSGVIRQVVAATAAPVGGRQVRRASALFGPLAASLHGGLGAARPLGHWTGAQVHPSEEEAGAADMLDLPPLFTAPGAQAIVAALPMPLADPDDRTVIPAAESQLALCKGLLATANAKTAADERIRESAAALAALDDLPLPAGHWLRAWYEGLIALVRDDLSGATGRFTAVRAALPGELIPQLALGLCAEHAREDDIARAHYKTAFDTTPALGAAGFGLARILHLGGATDEAVRVVDALAHEPSFEHEARIAEFRLLAERYGTGSGAADDLAAARARLDELDVDDAERAALGAELVRAEYLRGGDRLALSEAVRALAPHAPTEHAYTAVVDLANQLRPEPQWPRLLRRRQRNSPTSPERGNVVRHSRSGT